VVSDHNDRGETGHAATNPQWLPEWSDPEVDDETWVAALEASRRRQFAELSDL